MTFAEFLPLSSGDLTFCIFEIFNGGKFLKKMFLKQVIGSITTCGVSISPELVLYISGKERWSGDKTVG